LNPNRGGSAKSPARIGVQGLAENHVGRLNVILHFFGQGGHVRLVPVHHAVNQIHNVLAFALGDGGELLIQGSAMTEYIRASAASPYKSGSGSAAGGPEARWKCWTDRRCSWRPVPYPGSWPGKVIRLISCGCWMFTGVTMPSIQISRWGSRPRWHSTPAPRTGRHARSHPAAAPRSPQQRDEIGVVVLGDRDHLS